MNVSDSEVAVSILKENGFTHTGDIHEADIILVNTCSVRENAETRVWGRLDVFRQIRKKKPEIIIGIIGCMAERLKAKLLEEGRVDLVVGPDAYRDLPRLIKQAESGKAAINVQLSCDEMYEDISPARYGSNGVSAFVSIMRGCDNMCAFCVVPFTRGRERSRDPETILQEIFELKEKRFREVTLIGQNVDKYNWKNSDASVINFASLLERVATANPELRARFSTSYPQDMTDEVLHIMAKYQNICKSIHLPMQSGSTRILELMRRGYTSEWYMGRITAIKKILPGCAISTDIITGFCGETEEDHKDTLSLMTWAKFDFAFMFKYSERPNTFAQRNYKDDVPENIKAQRLAEIIALQNKLSAESKQQDLNKVFEVLVEGFSKKSKDFLSGRNSHNKVIVFPKKNYSIGDFVQVRVIRSTSATLIGEVVKK
ncbi:MAG: tRNA (N6-isopentenyl adenosine(37)-C2)-methylthiotransferase MiaB [Bacteroidia bacterium]|nr:tRNA (N6-isopentenyl adenosine(37)-C2)-methylthiotransferase MiaB [Bacteroidia bacterium]